MTKPARAITCPTARKRKKHQTYARPDADSQIARVQRPAERRCLRCRQMFMSSHSGNRICPACREWMQEQA